MHGVAWVHAGCRGARCARGRAWRICLYLVITSEMTKPICDAARCTRAHAVHARQCTRKPEGRAGPTPSSTSRRPGGPASPGARGCAPSRSHPSPPPPPPAAPQTRARTPARASARAGARARVGAVGLGRGRGRARAAATSTAESRACGSGGHRSKGSAGRHTHTHTCRCSSACESSSSGSAGGGAFGGGGLGERWMALGGCKRSSSAGPAQPPGGSS